MENKSHNTSTVEQLTPLVIAYLEADTWKQSKNIVQEYPELLTDTAISIIDSLSIEMLDDPETVREIQIHLHVLKECRRIGIDAAFKHFEDRNFLSKVKLPAFAVILLGIFVGTIYGLAQLMTLTNVAIGIIVVTITIGSGAFVVWELVWYFGNHGPVPTKVRILVLRSMFLSLGIDWRFRDTVKDPAQEMNLLTEALQLAEKFGRNKYLVATLHSYVGNRWRDNQIGERRTNLERSCFHYREAQKLFVEKHLTKAWLQEQMNLLSVYQQKASLPGIPWKDRLQTLVETLDLYQEAFEIHNDLNLLDRANLSLDGAILLMKIHKLTPVDTLEDAKEGCELALTVLTKETHPSRWAKCNEILGDIYIEREDWQRAINCYEQSSQIFNLDTSSYDWPGVQQRLGYAYYQHHEHSHDQKDLSQAIYHCKLALDAYEESALLWSSAETAYLLAYIYFTAERWQSAYDMLKILIDYKQSIFATAYTTLGRMSEISSTALVYPRAAYCLLKLNRFHESLICLESGKTRLFWEALALHNSDLDILPPDQRQAVQTFRKEIIDIESEYRLLQELSSAGNTLIEISTKLEQVRHRFSVLLRTIRMEYPHFMPANLDIADILATVPHRCALVMPLFTSQGSVMFVLPEGKENITMENIVWLDNFTDRDLRKFLHGFEEDPSGWLSAYMDLIKGGSREDWLRRMTYYTQQLWEKLLGRLHEKLLEYQISRVIFIPQGGLQILPLHIAWRNVEGQTRFFMDDFDVSFAPSVYALAVSQSHLSLQRNEVALVAGVKHYNKYPQLENSLIEAEIVASLFHVTAHLDNDVTRQAIIDSIGGITHLHLACHGEFAWSNDPLESALYLFNDEPLSLADICSRLDLRGTRLVVLSACETGISEIAASPDEAIGLPAGLIQAGVQTVISSLWLVNDFSTALLMHLFYQNYLNHGMSPLVSLREAQHSLRNSTRREIAGMYREIVMQTNNQEVRAARTRLLLGGSPDDRPFEHPHYWAAFTLSGS